MYYPQHRTGGHISRFAHEKEEPAMRSLFITAIVLAFPVIAMSATIHVPVDQPTIQAGIDAAFDGDTVLVAPGTYVENIDFKGKGVTLESVEGPHYTVIDGGSPSNPDYGSVVTFDSGEVLDSELIGCRV